jgi:DNA polymerase-3 subunit delta'
MIETHPAIRRLLARVLERGRLAQAYLFAGPEGAGKRTLAREFAAALVCERGAFPPCRQCGPCKRALAGNPPDVMAVEPEGKNIKIDSIRGLASRLNLHAYEGGRKVALVVSAELMNDHSQNAFLKTLEEPPADTVLIMTAANLNRILPTILSRCQVTRVPPLPESVIIEMLGHERGITGPDAVLIAALSEGNARKALDMDLEFVVEFRKQMVRRIVSLTPADRVAILEFAETMEKASRGQPVNDIFDLLIAFYRDALHLRLGRGRIANQDLRAEAEQQAMARPPGAALSKMETITRARARADGNANLKLNWEILTMALAGVEGAEITSP